MTTTGPASTICETVPLSAPPFGPGSHARYRLGRRVCRWIEANCVYGQGDSFGRPVRLRPFQKRFVMQLYELRADGGRRYRRALLEIPKGNGKTPISAWVGAYELCNRPSAVIPVAAASYAQADLLFGDLRDCVRESPSLSGVLDAFESEVQVKDGPGTAYKVAAIAGTNDGKRPTCFLADEVHEWMGNKARVHLVIANGLAKRSDSLNLNTTTPGYDLDSLAGRMHTHGLRVNSGEVVDDEFLFVWYGCPEDRFDLSADLAGSDPAGFHANLLAAVAAANPAAGSFLDVEATAARWYQVPAYEFLRYHLGLWTAVFETWLPTGAWDACAGDGPPAAGEPVVIAVDGSYNNDSTAVVGCTTSGPVPHLFVVGAWEKPEDSRVDWTVPTADVEAVIEEACRTWQVREVVFDPFRWQRTMEHLTAAGLPVVEFPQSTARMVPATSRMYESVVNGAVTHDGDVRLARHVGNAKVKEDARGRRLTKPDRHSHLKIDLAVTAVMALERGSAGVEADVGVQAW